MVDVKKVRLALNLSQEQFAELLGVDTRSISRWENGHNKPSPMAKKLLTLLALKS